jgi:hypothetical protein
MKTTGSLETKLCKCCPEAIPSNIKTLASLRFRFWYSFAAWLAAMLLTGAIVRAQSYSIDWYQISSGGGMSLGGDYSLAGTLGQPEAGSTTIGGNYSLTAGFWTLISIVPTPGAPTLTIAFTSTNTFIISWPSPSTGFAIQQSTAVPNSVWAAPSEGISDDGINKSIVLQSLTGTRFFRLKR